MEPMIPIEDRIDKNLTRKEIRKHLRFLGKGIFKMEIMDYLSFSSSIIKNPKDSGTKTKYSSPDASILNLIEKKDKDNQDIDTYLRWIIDGINKLKPESRKVLLGKFVYQYDVEEFEKTFGCSMYSIKRKILDSELELSLVLNCFIIKS